MRNVLFLIILCCFLAACDQPKPETASAPAKPPRIEFGDTTKSQLCKEGIMALAAGDVDSFTRSLADNVVYAWNSGDSIAGKAAIADYWKDRHANVIEKMDVSKVAILSLKVNESKVAPPGDYVFMWASVTASYKGGKSMTQLVHNIYSFDSYGKISRITQFIDRVPIMAAMPAKK